MPLLKLENVSKRFGGLVAVNDVSFSIEPGELVAIVGPNGAGKTTLFNLLNGVHLPDTGTITFNGHDITRYPAHRRAHVGLGRTFQIPRPFASSTVLENIAIGAMFGAEGHQTSTDKAMQMAEHYIELIGLQDHRDKLSGSLTPNEKKMVELARALAMKPKLLLMDEVMAGMNPKDIDGLVDVLKTVREAEKIAVVGLVEHIMRAVARFAQRVIVMHYGAKLVDEPTQKALTDPRVVDVYLGGAREDSHAKD